MPPPKKKPETEEEKQKREKSIQAAKNYRLLKKQQVADQEKKVDELMKENKRLLDEVGRIGMGVRTRTCLLVRHVCYCTNT
ncbi:hypothetical protein SARC_02314 [Sphaeroforma arctica JP610]|uniref:BZIP domain-containing protein n=1 Tax=Sphaeroforma arctica JP610 TaxID=667725 RepID=A0A0L0GB78_9EUKA|nr:hypothetical protein SARC_02314 [Sphaeroforma arctica JP610]KNC85513.1 hypothetical protein SARC_02314 [Sphaeroforma arctica JP610]|eukprot:XP_014159415.1 hypothetical protein SARC_02314 [Sphaeroforma arctica JP610]